MTFSGSLGLHHFLPLLPIKDLKKAPGTIRAPLALISRRGAG